MKIKLIRIFIILRFFFRLKIIFKNPSKYELVFFDDTNKKFFKDVLDHYNFFVLQNRIENINKIYCSFKILKYFFKYYKGNIMTAYLTSLLETISPKVVLTNIDNSYKFSDVARNLSKKMTFVAVQNAARYELKENEYLYRNNIVKSDVNKFFFIPNFLCFGQFEIDNYKHYGIKVENFFKIGSLRLANAFEYIRKNNLEIKRSTYDICLISESPHRRDDFFKEKKVANNIAAIEKFTIKFCMSHNKKLIFLWRGDKKLSSEIFNREVKYYKKHLTESEFNYLNNNSFDREIDKHTSYISMLQSNVVVGNRSTLLRENLATGGKILNFSFTSTNIWDFPIQGVCSLKNSNYPEFEKRLLDIYSMSEKEYFSKLNKDKNYTVEFDKNISTIEILKERIDYFLSKNNH